MFGAVDTARKLDEALNLLNDIRGDMGRRPQKQLQPPLLLDKLPLQEKGGIDQSLLSTSASLSPSSPSSSESTTPTPTPTGSEELGEEEEEEAAALSDSTYTALLIACGRVRRLATGFQVD
jgi:hypothetical protein